MLGKGGRSGEDEERGSWRDGWVFSVVRCGVASLSGCVCDRDKSGRMDRRMQGPWRGEVMGRNQDSDEERRKGCS